MTVYVLNVEFNRTLSGKIIGWQNYTAAVFSTREAAMKAAEEKLNKLPEDEFSSAQKILFDENVPFGYRTPHHLFQIYTFEIDKV